MHRLIELTNLSLYFTKQLCFDSFNYTIHAGDRIALIGDNGSGKSSMLKIIKQLIQPSEGSIRYTHGLTIAYVPQLIDSVNPASGAELFHKALTKALAQVPDVLLLDEPTNHLDSKSKHSLLRLLDQFDGSLIIASHDLQLLKHRDYYFWHFNQKKIEVFHGSFENLHQQRKLQAQIIEEKIEQIQQQKKKNHQALMKEQQRAKTSRFKGEKSLQQSKWPTIVSKTKMLRGQETSGKKKKQLADQKELLINQLEEIAIEEGLLPQFTIPPAFNTNKALITITQGQIAYGQNIILRNIDLNCTGRCHLAIYGANGSGKSTLLKAIMNDPAINKEGLWTTPNPQEIGYLDQHYRLLNDEDSVLSTIESCRQDWPHALIRQHLNSFLFRSNKQVHAQITTLSGGEKARLCLAKIAAKPPRLLILDELTNNLDLKTRNHVITILKNYPGAFIVVSHDHDFLAQIDINSQHFL